MNLRTTLRSSRRALRRPSHGWRLPAATRRPALYVAVATAGALMVNVLTTGDPAARAAADSHPVNVAQQLGPTARTNGFGLADLQPSQDPSDPGASRSQREVLQSAAAQAQAAAQEAERQRQAAEAAAQAEAQRKAAEQAAAQQAAQQQQAAAQAAVVSADPGSIQGWTASFMAATYGWGGDQMSCLVSLWNKESGWRVNAANPSSGAYGIPQALPGGKMASAGGDWQTNPQTQVKWGLSYIQGSYGTPCGAWGHSQATGWY